MNEEQPHKVNEIEICDNPFTGKKCGSTDIVIYIMFKGKKKTLCRECWSKIADKNKEWGDNSKPENFAATLEKDRGLEGAVLTEYVPRKDRVSEKDNGENNSSEEYEV